MLLGTDASRHDWLEDPVPRLTPVGVADDATSNVPAEHFDMKHEDAAGYLRLFRQLVTSAGIPLSIYRDQHGTMQRNDKHWSLEEELAGRAVSHARGTGARRTGHRTDRGTFAPGEGTHRAHMENFSGPAHERTATGRSM